MDKFYSTEKLFNILKNTNDFIISEREPHCKIIDNIELCRGGFTQSEKINPVLISKNNAKMTYNVMQMYPLLGLHSLTLQGAILLYKHLGVGITCNDGYNFKTIIDRRSIYE